MPSAEFASLPYLCTCQSSPELDKVFGEDDDGGGQSPFSKGSPKKGGNDKGGTKSAPQLDSPRM